MAEDYMTQETNRKAVENLPSGVVKTVYYADNNTDIIRTEIYRPAQISGVMKHTGQKYLGITPYAVPVPTITTYFEESKDHAFIYQAEMMDGGRNFDDENPIAMFRRIKEGEFEVMTEPLTFVSSEAIRMLYGDRPEGQKLSIVWNVPKPAA